MILPIYTYGQGVLRTAAEGIDTNSAEVREEMNTLVKDMFETLRNAEGVGLAAPQIGRNIQLLVIDLSDLSETTLAEHPDYATFKKVFINPDIYELSEETDDYEEGCLSIPGVHEKVTRPVGLRVRYIDEQFQPQDEELAGFPARVLQHECDHLAGKMFVDHISALRKQMIRGKLNNLLQGKVHADYKTKSVRRK